MADGAKLSKIQNELICLMDNTLYHPNPILSSKFGYDVGSSVDMQSQLISSKFATDFIVVTHFMDYDSTRTGALLSKSHSQVLINNLEKLYRPNPVVFSKYGYDVLSSFVLRSKLISSKLLSDFIVVTNVYVPNFLDVSRISVSKILSQCLMKTDKIYHPNPVVFSKYGYDCVAQSNPSSQISSKFYADYVYDNTVVSVQYSSKLCCDILVVTEKLTLYIEDKIVSPNIDLEMSVNKIIVIDEFKEKNIYYEKIQE